MFILKKDFDEENPRDYPLFQERFQNYKNYLESIEHKLKPSAREFALADWRYDFQDHKCPHDSWVEHLKIYETSSGERRQIRFTQIELKLLGAYHDGYLVLNYCNVQNYCINNSSDAHGDWLYDEIRISEDNLVIHEIEFLVDTYWIIKCEDIKSNWIPFDK